MRSNPTIPVGVRHNWPRSKGGFAKQRRRGRIVVRHPALLRMGTNFLIWSVGISAFYTTDPSLSDWGFGGYRVLKYAPTVLAAMAAACYLVSTRWARVGWPVWCVLVFALGCVSGGGVTCFVQGADLMDSFIGRGLCAAVLPAAYFGAQLPTERRKMARQVSLIVILAASVMMMALIGWRLGFRFVDRNHIYHEDAIIFCAAAGFCVAAGSVWARRIGSLVFALASALTIKLTGFGFAVAGIGLLWRVESLAGLREDRSSVVARRLIMVLFIAASAVTSFVLVRLFSDYMPDGSTEVRLVTYAHRLSMFIASPIWGTGFFGSPNMTIGHLYIPSHSDLLDIFAFGGLVGGLLFLLPAALAVRSSIGRLPWMVSNEDGLATFALLTTVCFVFEMAFNPVFFDPRLVTLYWFALGVALADRETQSRVDSNVRAGRLRTSLSRYRVGTRSAVPVGTRLVAAARLGDIQ